MNSDQAIKRASWLITGGTGYLGRALAKDLLAQDCQRVCIYSRGELAQAQMRREFEDDPRLRWFIGDVRDSERLSFAARECDVIVHAAALKRVEVGEYNPEEMMRTNVIGTRNAIAATLNEARPSRMVLVSSDKACAPLNAYGATKLLAEKLVLGAHNMVGESGPRFAVVRYGNVAGSTGSVIPIWRDASTQPVMRDAEATRFWISRHRAIELIVWCVDNMCGGETFVPTLSAYRLQDLADAMGINPTHRTLLPGEKQHEQMVSKEEASEFRIVTCLDPPIWIRGGDEQTYSPAWYADDGGLNPYATESLSSDRSPRMTVHSLQFALLSVNDS